MTIALLIAGGVLISIAGARVLQHLERDELFNRSRHGRFSKRQIHRITQQLSQTPRP